nr:keratin, type I cytoskeletal 10-like [Pocillopora verrucosa]
MYMFHFFCIIQVSAGQGGETKPETKELAEEAKKPVEQVESEEIPRASDKAGKSEEKVESEEILIPSDEAQKAEEEEKKRLEPDMEDTEKASFLRKLDQVLKAGSRGQGGDMNSGNNGGPAPGAVSGFGGGGSGSEDNGASGRNGGYSGGGNGTHAKQGGGGGGS